MSDCSGRFYDRCYLQAGTLTAVPSRNEATSPILRSVQPVINSSEGTLLANSTPTAVFTSTVQNRPPRMHAGAIRTPGWSHNAFRPPAHGHPAHPPRATRTPKEGGRRSRQTPDRRRTGRRGPPRAAAARQSSSRAHESSSDAGVRLPRTAAAVPTKAAADAGATSGTACSKMLH